MADPTPAAADVGKVADDVKKVAEMVQLVVPDPSPPAVKPGYATSEFYIAGLLALFGFLHSIGVLGSANADALTKAVPQIAGALAAVAYIVSRAWLKVTAHKAAGTVTPPASRGKPS